jgi:ribosomal protein L11 methyltransferase
MKIISFKAPHKFIKQIEDCFENVCIFEDPKFGFSDNCDENDFRIADVFSIEIFANEEQESEIMSSLFKFSNEIFEIRAIPINHQDWVKLYTNELKPTIIEEFCIIPKHLKPICIDAAMAFGSGDHPTTRACISMMSNIGKSEFTPNRALDMGCGSGILAICAAKIWPEVRIIAIDIDDEAVNIARENFLSNGILGDVVLGENLSIFTLGEGLDLILCNILKKPLEGLSHEFFNALRKGGKIVISGFTIDQHEDIDYTYKSVGFEYVDKVQIDDWVTILYQK